MRRSIGQGQGQGIYPTLPSSFGPFTGTRDVRQVRASFGPLPSGQGDSINHHPVIRRHTENEMNISAASFLVPESAGLSAPQGSSAQSQQEESLAGRAKTRKDLTQYEARKIFHLEDKEEFVKILTVPNGVTDETLLAIQSRRAVFIYRLKETETDGPEGEKKKDFSLIKVQEVRLRDGIVGAFAINYDISVTLPPLRLCYAFSKLSSTNMYYFDLRTDQPWPEKIVVEDAPDKMENQFAEVAYYDHGSPVTAIALKNYQYAAVLTENDMVSVWDLKTETVNCTFQLNSCAVEMTWHPWEDWKLCVVEATGYVKFFNVMKEKCYMVKYMCQPHLYAGDWSISNSLIGAVGWAGGVTVFNTSQYNTNSLKTHEKSGRIFKKVMFCPGDEKILATLEKGVQEPTTVRVWKSPLPNCLWHHSSDQFIDLAWMHAGKPYVVVLGHQQLHIFEANVNNEKNKS